MKSADEVLLQEKTKQLRRTQDQAGWDAIIRDCRAPRWPSLIALLVWPVAICALLYRENPMAFRPVYGAAAAGFAYVAIRFALACYRRERGLRALIAREAPELAEKLQREAV